MEYKMQILVVFAFCGLAAAQMSMDYSQPRYIDGGIDFCPTCVQFSEQAINQLLNIILNAGVVSGCGEVCGILANKTGSQTLGAVCTMLCDVVGVQAFSKLIEKADLDPIYYCELLTLCPVNDHGDAKLANLTAVPNSGPQGTTFQLNMQYHSKNGTGTGEMFVGLETVDGVPIQSSFLMKAQQPGNYQASIKIDASPDPSCDPTQQPCEQWLPGNYTAMVALCNGECGSKHPHSQIYDQQKVTFTITG